MFWQKNWWETRWVFLFTLGLLILVCVFFLWLEMKADPSEWAASTQREAVWWGESRRQVLPLQATHQGMVWTMWFKFFMTGMWPVLAMFMGMTILKSFPLFDGSPGGPGLFTLSLPITRRKLILSHWVVVIIEMTLISLAPASLISIISNFSGRWFPMKDAVLYSLFMGIGGMVFVSLSYLLLVILRNNVWGLIGSVVVVNIISHWPLRVIREYPWWNIYHVMTGETYFRYGQIPWPGLLASLAVSVLIMFVAVRIYERGDF